MRVIYKFIPGFDPDDLNAFDECAAT